MTEPLESVLFERHPQPMWVVDRREGTFLAVNDAALSRFGYTRERFLALPVAELRAHAGFPTLLETWLCAQAGDVESAPHTLGVAAFRSADGVRIHAELTVSGVEWGQRAAALCLLVDVTERVRSEEAARRSEERFVALTHAVDGLIWEFNVKTGEVWRGEGARDRSGWRRPSWPATSANG
jgi:PAS domain S-box-containing protein